MNIGREILKIRESRGINQKALAEAAGIRPSNLCRLESGNGNPCWATVEKLLDVMGCHLEISQLRQSRTP